MKILFLTGADHKYGTPRMASYLIQASKIAESDLEYVVVTQKRGPVNEFCDSIQVENYVVPYRYAVYSPCKNKVIDFFKRNIKRLITIAYTLCAWISIHQRIDFDNIDIIHTNLDRDIFGTVLAAYHNKPHVCHLREFLYGHFKLSMLFPNQTSFMNLHTDCFIAVSRAVRDAWVDIGLDREKIKIVYDGIASSSILEGDKKRSRNGIRFVMIGHIAKDKGQMQLIKAIRILRVKYKREIQVDFYGDGKEEYIDELVSYVHGHGLSDNIRFLGYQKDAARKLWQYDVGFNCSKSEGFGLVTIEYMMAGVCPIVSNTGANVELVTDCETGLMYKYGDEMDLAEKIHKVIENPGLIRTLSENARNVAETKYTLDNYVKGIDEIYYKISDN